MLRGATLVGPLWPHLISRKRYAPCALPFNGGFPGKTYCHSALRLVSPFDSFSRAGPFTRTDRICSSGSTAGSL